MVRQCVPRVRVLSSASLAASPTGKAREPVKDVAALLPVFEANGDEAALGAAPDLYGDGRPANVLVATRDAHDEDVFGLSKILTPEIKLDDQVRNQTGCASPKSNYTLS